MGRNVVVFVVCEEEFVSYGKGACKRVEGAKTAVLKKVIILRSMREQAQLWLHFQVSLSSTPANNHNSFGTLCFPLSQIDSNPHVRTRCDYGKRES